MYATVVYLHNRVSPDVLCFHHLPEVVAGSICETMDVVCLQPRANKVQQLCHTVGRQSVQKLLFYHPKGTFHVGAGVVPSGGQLRPLLSPLVDLLHVSHKLCVL